MYIYTVCIYICTRYMHIYFDICISFHYHITVKLTDLVAVLYYMHTTNKSTSVIPHINRYHTRVALQSY